MIDAQVKAAQAGDRRATERLLAEHYDRVWRVCRRLTGNDADAADATQEAMIAIVRGLPRFDGRSTFSTWIYRVATNAALDELRRRGRRALPTDSLPDAVVAARDSAVVDRLSVDEALAELPEEFRAAVVLRDLADLDYAEIAEALQIPAGTVRSRIARGRAQLARRFGNQDDGGERQKALP
jgi:RNA polymerase sigma-70 factor (ECF subfamily)